MQENESQLQTQTTLLGLSWDYLLSLRERYRREHEQPFQILHRSPREQEIVIVNEENVPRAEWKLGRITRVRKDEQGTVRTADILMPNGHILHRPVSMLFPLEISEEEQEPIVDSRERSFARLPNDHNLEAEAEEDKSEEVHRSSTKIGLARTTVTKSFLTLTALIALILSTSTASQFHLCLKQGHGLYVKLPQELNCTNIREEHHQTTQMVGVWRRTFLSTEATFCSSV
ncbi:unnamed protein product, partial [Anisakis simplex]|uniref:DUF5641 domain-containing protein n=1 Tax=Anisakis simplex TaxID=6269 RepID=A0A0M3JJQ5_ANISI